MKYSIGSLGEEIAQKFLDKKGYVFVCKNYRKPWGEIDLVMCRADRLLFVEVKTVESPSDSWSVVVERRRPEERVTREKLAKLRRVIESYVLEKRVEEDWCFGVCGVLLDVSSKRARVALLFEPL